MAATRYTMLFEFAKGNIQAGFSESWDAGQATGPVMQDLAEGIALRRRSFLSHDWRIRDVKISRLLTSLEAGLPAPCRLVERNVGLNWCYSPADGQLTDDTDSPWAAALYEIRTAPGTTESQGMTQGNRPRLWQIRGIPDTWWTDAEMTIPKQAQVQIDDFMKYMKDEVQFAQVKTSPASGLGCDMIQTRYKTWCFKRASNRRIGRPFGLLRGRRSSREEEA